MVSTKLHGNTPSTFSKSLVTFGLMAEFIPYLNLLDRSKSRSWCARHIVYVSSPIKALVGAFQVERVVENSKGQLWKVVQMEAGITRKEFNAYYDDHTRGIGIFSTAVKVTQSL